MKTEDEIKYLKELEAKGYTITTCKHCKGLGKFGNHYSLSCYACFGKGYQIKAPIAR